MVRTCFCIFYADLFTFPQYNFPSFIFMSDHFVPARTLHAVTLIASINFLLCFRGGSRAIHSLYIPSLNVFFTQILRIMSSRLLIVSALLLGLAFGIFGACRATTSNEDGFVTDEDPSESSYTPHFLEDHLENGKHGSAIQPCCSQGQAGVDNAHYLFVSTMDGSVSALDVSDGGKLSWNSQSFEDGSPLLSGTLSSTQVSIRLLHAFIHAH
uniref:PQQ_3 domain-containing protein n=1 Tax=Steinernema glaseri TaxID=37863 RepID=A0A1I7Z7S8_9BILA